MDGIVTPIAELLATALVQGTAVIMVTAVIVLLLRRARPALLAALWTVALLKFAVPVGPELPFALTGLLPDVGEVSLAANVDTVAVSARAGASFEMRGLTSGGVWPAMLALLLAAWAIGCLFVGSRRVAAGIGLGRRVGKLPVANATRLHAVARACRHVGVRRAPLTRVDEGAAGAYLVGWWAPVLVLPSWPEGETLDAMLLHELAHVRRRDPMLRLVQVVISTLFFFWPPVHWVSRQIDLLREQACDQWAVSRGDIRPSAFARILVEVAARARRGHPDPGLAMAPRSGHLERRVVHLMTRRQRPALSAAMAGGVLIWSAVALAGAERHSAALDGETLCATDPRISEQILASHPDADIDGDGSLSKDEVCAHQMRMHRRLVDEVVSEMPEEQLLRADVDGDGALSSSELSRLKDRLIVTVREGQDTGQSELLLQVESPLRSELVDREDFATVEASRFALETAEVAGAVCEPGIGRCIEKQGGKDEAFLLIDVAVRPAD